MDVLSIRGQNCTSLVYIILLVDKTGESMLIFQIFIICLTSCSEG